MGMTVFSGMLVATVIGVLMVPALYVIIERYVARPKPVEDAAGAAGGGQGTPGVASKAEEP
jgi:HAE1 family hydrophobic/amphiphilic exporter-1